MVSGFNLPVSRVCGIFLKFLYVLKNISGKDRIIFVTKEDHETPSSAELVADDPNDPYEDHGEYFGNSTVTTIPL